jgi:protein-S-isoprenylcysteine O-methyltransferase Ste14
VQGFVLSARQPVGFVVPSTRNAIENPLRSVGLWLFRRRSFLAVAALPIAISGLSSYTYLAGNRLLTETWELLCFAISICGLSLRAFTVAHVACGTSSRVTKAPEAASLNTTGMYSLVRHPLYLGNYLAVLGCMLFFHRVWIVVAGTGLFMLFYGPIIYSEEAFLRSRFGAFFDQWAQSTPACIPRLHGWRRPDLPFAWRTVLQREYTGFLVVSAAFFLLHSTADRLVSGDWELDFWAVLLLFAAVVYSTLRTLKRRTKVLDVDGR